MCLDAVDVHRPIFGPQLLYRAYGVEQHEVEMVVLTLLVEEPNIEVLHTGGQVHIFDPTQRHDRVHLLGQLSQGGDATDPHLVVVGMPDGIAGLGEPAIGVVERVGPALANDMGGSWDQARVVKPGQPCNANRQRNGTADAPAMNLGPTRSRSARPRS